MQMSENLRRSKEREDLLKELEIYVTMELLASG